MRVTHFTQSLLRLLFIALLEIQGASVAQWVKRWPTDLALVLMRGQQRLYYEGVITYGLVQNLQVIQELYEINLVNSSCVSSIHTYLLYFFGYKTEFFSFRNNPKNLDPSYKMDLDLCFCLGRVKLVL